jgi:nitrous oxidase accessory protein NosD
MALLGTLRATWQVTFGLGLCALASASTLAAACGSETPPDATGGSAPDAGVGGHSGGTGGGDAGSGGAVSSAVCPIGQAPGEDALCQPIGIKGCAERFIDPDGVCRPAMAKCADMPGTIPKFEVGCIGVGIQSCAPEFIDDDDGLCRPSMDKCAATPGTFAAPQLGCVPIDGPLGCGAGAWGNIPDGPDTLYVDPSYLGGSSDGTKAQPFKTINEALAIAPPGGRIALAAGTYDGSTVITKSLTLEGRCPSMVHLNNTGVGATIFINGAPDVTVRGVRISGEDYGIGLESAASARVEGVHIKSARKAAVFVRGASTSLTIESTLIEETQPNASTQDGGEAIDIGGGGSLSVSDSALVGNRNHGVLILDAGTKAGLTDVLVEDTLPSAKDDTDGYGLYIGEGATVSLTSSAVVGNRKGGVTVQDKGTSGLLVENLIERTTPQVSSGKLGVGVDAVDGALVTATRNAILDNTSAGVRVIGPGSILQSLENWAAFNKPSITPRTGVGFEIQEGAQAFLIGDIIYQNHIVGIFVFNFSAVHATGVLVEQTQPLPGSNHDGAGALTLLTSTPSIYKSCAFVDNFVAALAFGGSQGIVKDSLLSGTKAGSFADDEGGVHTDYGDGLTVGFTSTVTAERTIMERAARAGILFDQSGGAVTSCESRENGFGVVIQRMPRPDFNPEQSSVHSNSKSNIVSDGDLSVPSAVPGG